MLQLSVDVDKHGQFMAFVDLSEIISRSSWNRALCLSGGF